MQISEFEYVPTTLHIPNFFFQPGKKYFLRKFWKKQLMCYSTHGFTNFEFELTFFVFAHYSTSLYYITIPNVPWGPPNVKVVQIALCLNFLMSSAGLLFKAALLLLAQEYLVAYLLHELLENFWAAHAFCPFGAMPARLVLHAPSALQKGPLLHTARYMMAWYPSQKFNR